MEETISLQDIFLTLKKHSKLIFLTTFIAGVIAVIISFFLITPIYQANSQVLVTQKKQEVSQQMTATDIQTNLQIINTYYEVIKSPAILNIVIDNLDLDIMPSQLASKITVSSANNSQVINVSVQDKSHGLAVELANQIVTVFKDKVPQLMNVDNVNILAPAEKVDNPSPVKPNKMLNVAIALVLGLMVGVGLAFLLQYLDKTVKTEQDIEELLGLPVIGLISTIEMKDVASSDTKQRRKRVTDTDTRVGV